MEEKHSSNPYLTEDTSLHSFHSLSFLDAGICGTCHYCRDTFGTGIEDLGGESGEAEDDAKYRWWNCIWGCRLFCGLLNFGLLGLWLLRGRLIIGGVSKRQEGIQKKSLTFNERRRLE
ncbi:hypothetical protein EJ08DRAFT_266969 [Tothia fuscella]|uniref:Uncharacterized protein n=1 Tax=Tothia fuscella TaxID=1048955 RepID=A0A9P4NQE9_9PEZI|nr:hypothetical protein EJ08DRAFT_266969 [Tothia fuscella]